MTHGDADVLRSGMKLLLSSFGPPASHDQALAELAGTAAPRDPAWLHRDAFEVYPDQMSLEEGRASLRSDGYVFELVDLRQWREDKPGLRELLSQFDAFLLAGGNPYYLRSLMRTTGADELITERVRDGAVYAGASAAAVVAGPTLRHFDELDSPEEAEEVIWVGLGLTQIAPD